MKWINHSEVVLKPVDFFGLKVHVYSNTKAIAADEDGEVYLHELDPQKSYGFDPSWSSRGAQIFVGNVDLEGLFWEDAIVKL